MNKVVFITLSMLLTHVYGYTIPAVSTFTFELEEEAVEKDCYFLATVADSCSAGAKIKVFQYEVKETQVDEGATKVCLAAVCTTNEDGALSLSKGVFIGGPNVDATPGILDQQSQLMLYSGSDECRNSQDKGSITIECKEENEIDDSRSAFQEMGSLQRIENNAVNAEIESKTAKLQLDNWFRATLRAECRQGYALSSVTSHHSNHYEDRLWDFECKNLRTKVDFDDCYWSGYQSGYDEPSFLNCRADYVMVGVHSDKYSTGARDRLFQIRCCHVPNFHTRSCSLSGFVNGWDGPINYSVDGIRVFTGMYSYHDNSKEDRRFQFSDCYYRL